MLTVGSACNLEFLVRMSQTMSERYATYIEIGGRIHRSEIEPLLKAISEDGVRTDWGEPYFEPETADELLEACKEGRLRLCDEEARYGEFTQLEQSCRELGLGYRRHCEGTNGYDAWVTGWWPGLAEPVGHRSSNEHPGDIVILASEVEKAITMLESGHIQPGIDLLKRACPDLPDLPPFEVV